MSGVKISYLILDRDATMWYRCFDNSYLWRPMKRLHFPIFLVLILPLLAAFTQAADVKALDCPHCMGQSFVQEKECCSMPKTAMEVHGAAHAEEENSSCTHGGFCQERDALPVSTGTITAVDFHTKEASEGFLLSPPSPVTSKTGWGRPPPLLSPHAIFLLNCTFLI